MDERAGAIVKEIFDERQKLGDNLAELETRVKHAADWRVQLQRNPWMIIGAAFGGGLLLSKLIPSRSR